jgi:tetratricopeptide (TPR) repeat protein
MKTLTTLLFALGCATAASAQTINLKSGNVVAGDGMARQNDMIMTTVKTPSGGLGQIGYYITDIAKLNIPEPAAMTEASSDVGKGDFNHAMVEIQPVVAEQKTFRDVPGNWWAQAALVEVEALRGLKRNDDVRSLAAEITANSHDPEILAGAALAVTMVTTFKTAPEALAAYDDIISRTVDPHSLSQAWIAKGDIFLDQHQFDEALLAYVTVIVFYADDNPLIPEALWGSSQAYIKLKDTARALEACHQLVTKYPDTPEAALAKIEIMKKENKT